MYLLDSSAIIDWLYSKRLGDEIKGPLSVSTISLSELLPSAREKGQRTFEALNRFFAQVRKIEIDEPIAREAANYKFDLRRMGQEKPIIDLLIASTAKLNDLILVTLDKDFEVITNNFDLNIMLFDQE